MDILLLLALGLLVILTVVGIYGYLRDRKLWKWLIARADESDLEERNDI